MNIPVENSSLNIEINADDDDDERQHIHLLNEQNEQLEVFVGFYRPGEYQRETMEDDDDDESESSQRSDIQKKEEQVRQITLIIQENWIFFCVLVNSRIN
jgi:hypothetical protein